MSRLGIDFVKTQLEEQGWKLLSTSYINLDTPMDYQCNKGHNINLPYKNIRDKFICPICKQTPFKELEILPEKTQDIYRIIGMDQATILSGFSIYDDKQLMRYGVIHPKEDLSTIHRISVMCKWLEENIKELKPDLIIFEDIQLQNFSGKKNAYNKGKENSIGITTYKTLAELLGALKLTAFINNTAFEVVPSSTWRSGVGVTGRTRSDKKRSAQIIVENLYNIKTTQDEADAILIGKHGSHVFKSKNLMINWE